jgi:hypothetical protein
VHGTVSVSCTIAGIASGVLENLDSTTIELGVGSIFSLYV